VNRRDFLKATLVGGTALACPSWLEGLSDKLASRPNIVLIMADDLGLETLGCYRGKDYQTPHLDALASRGVRFTHCHSQPLCTPSRVQLMTGRYNHRNYQGFGYLDPQEVTFSNLLQSAGYRTCIAGKWQLCGDAETVRGFGFDDFCLWNMHRYREGTRNAKEPESWKKRYASPTLYENGQWTEHSEGIYGPDVCCDFVCSFIEKHRKQPFLVYYPMILTHTPFVPTPDSIDQAESNKKRNFGDMVRYMDKIVGKIVSQLEKQGILDNTLLLFTGDNGTHPSITSLTETGTVKGGKSKTIDSGTHVPLIASWPGTAPPGRVVDDLVDFSDFLPTLCEAAGCAQPEDRVIDGRSFFPQLQGKKGFPREWIYCHYWERGRVKERTREFVRDKRWKLYDNGQLFDTASDALEQTPLVELNEEALEAQERLRKAFAAVRKKQ